MEMEGVSRKISKNVKNQNSVRNFKLREEIGDILLEDLKRKRSKMDKYMKLKGNEYKKRKIQEMVKAGEQNKKI